MAIKERSEEKKTSEAKKEPKKPKGKQSSKPDLFTEESPPPSVILESI